MLSQDHSKETGASGSPIPPADPSSSDVDVVILGGALAGASCALLLLRRWPQLRVTVLERSNNFGRRVGEATVEVSAFFLGRVLGLTQHLNESHLVKQGMRFWFCNEQTRQLDEASEIGGRYQARLPSYQLDRAVLDEEVLRQANAAGARVLRGARVRRVDLNSGGAQTVDFSTGDTSGQIRARWVIDASGFASLLARQEGWLRPNDAHPTSAIWSRWRGVKDWDGHELATRFPAWASACHGVRGTATNHLMGDGWWAWVIPLKGGDVSIGVVFDQRRVRWQSTGSLAAELKDFLCAHPVGRELMANATAVNGDAHRRARLAYSSSRHAGDGFVLVGDAGAFLDPFYSPGMDWLSYGVTRAVDLISTQLEGGMIGTKIEAMNRDFNRSYERWFAALYQNKYDYLGDFELMRVAFRLDLGLYYLGVVSQPFVRGREMLRNPVFSTPPSVPFFHLIKTYNRRLSRMAISRRRRGVFGRRNTGRRLLVNGYSFEAGSYLPMAKAFAGWLWLEISEGWRSWFGRSVQSDVGRLVGPEKQGAVAHLD